MLLHPGPGLDGSIFLPFLAPLAASHELIALDLHSDDPTPPDGLAAITAAVRETVIALGLEDYTLLGHSFGGFVALQHAVRYPGHAARLVVSASVADERVFEHVGASIEAFASPSVEAAFEREGSVSTQEEALSIWIDQVPFFVAEPGGAGEAAFVDALRGVEFSVAAMRHDDYGDHDVMGSLGEVAVPALVLAGAKDRMMPPEYVGAIAEAIPGAELVVFENAGHFAFAECPDEYLSALGGWLAR